MALKELNSSLTSINCSAVISKFVASSVVVSEVENKYSSEPSSFGDDDSVTLTNEAGVGSASLTYEGGLPSATNDTLQDNINKCLNWTNISEPGLENSTGPGSANGTSTDSSYEFYEVSGEIFYL